MTRRKPAAAAGLITAYGIAAGAISLLISVTLGVVAQWAFFPFIVGGGLLLGLRLGKWAAS